MSRSNNSATANDVMKKELKEKEDAAAAPCSPQPEKVLYDNRIKRKNVLALNEKVAAIREYEKVPVYKRIGRMFHCSPDQIKRIVQQKDEILKAWEQRTRRCQDAKTLEMKVVRVSMLGKAVYDWIRRMMYYKDFMITDGLIQKMALQFKSAMSLPNFFPHTDWCDKFRQTYKINSHDSKQLKIGYTQGHSVQIKDVMKDVLSECTPDVIGDNRSNDENDNESASANDKRKSVKKGKNAGKSTAVVVQQKLPQQQQQQMPQLQPIRQFPISLPMQANCGVGAGVRMSQKVLVATPINATGQKNGKTPMTMTIIPLTTIGQCTQNSGVEAAQTIVTVAAPTKTNKKSTVPTPIVEIKKEIKQEKEEEPLKAVQQMKIKEEVISDDDEDDSMLEQAEQQNSAAATTKRPQLKDGVDAVDNEDMALASLRNILQNKINEPPPTTTVPSTVRTVTTTPPLPPLTRAPHIVNRTANKRKLNQDAQTLPAIETCSEARKYLKLLEDFALFKENFRLIGLITRADEVLRELDGDDDVDIG